MSFLCFLVLSVFLFVRKTFSKFFGKKLTPLWECPHCSHAIYSVSDIPSMVDHLWEEHQHPSEMSLNGHTYRSGPTAILDRFVLRILAERRIP